MSDTSPRISGLYTGILAMTQEVSLIQMVQHTIMQPSDREDNLLPKCDPPIFGPHCIELICGAVDLYRLAISALLRVFGIPAQSVILEGGIELQNVLIGISSAAALITSCEGKRILLKGSCEISRRNNALVSKRL